MHASFAYKNVTQRNRISDLIAAVTQTYVATIDHFTLPTSVINQMQADHLEYYVTWWAKKPIDLGIVQASFSSQSKYVGKLKKLHLRTIIAYMCRSHSDTDKKIKNRYLLEDDVQCTKESYFKILCNNYGQCAICYCYLTVKANLPTDLSYDRISNSHSHGEKNLRPVCSIHQAPNGFVTECMQIHECCLQTRVHVSSDARAKMIARHDELLSDGIPCPYCDVERLE
jgi:hypothetical protein